MTVVLSVVSLLAVAQLAKADVVIYDLTFSPSQWACLTACTDYPANGQKAFPIGIGSETMISSGDTIEIVTDSNCCSSTAKLVADIQVYKSADGGRTWVPSGNPIFVYQPGGSCDTEWRFTLSQVDGSVAGSRPNVLQTCTQQQ